MDLSPRVWGRAVEALKDAFNLPNNFHGKIDALGNYLDKSGNIIDNLLDYLP
jgi:hypothetical protein